MTCVWGRVVSEHVRVRVRRAWTIGTFSMSRKNGSRTSKRGTKTVASRVCKPTRRRFFPFSPCSKVFSPTRRNEFAFRLIAGNPTRGGSLPVSATHSNHGGGSRRRERCLAAPGARPERLARDSSGAPVPLERLARRVRDLAAAVRGFWFRASFGHRRERPIATASVLLTDAGNARARAPALDARATPFAPAGGMASGFTGNQPSLTPVATGFVASAQPTSPFGGGPGGGASPFGGGPGGASPFGGGNAPRAPSLTPDPNVPNSEAWCAPSFDIGGVPDDPPPAAYV